MAILFQILLCRQRPRRWWQICQKRPSQRGAEAEGPEERIELQPPAEEQPSLQVHYRAGFLNPSFDPTFQE